MAVLARNSAPSLLSTNIALKPGQGIHYKSTDREVQMLEQEVREDGERYRAANGITGKN